MKLLSAISLFLAYKTVLACEEHDAHDHVHAKRLFPQTNLPTPSTPLVWGDVNIIHTTDTHGWLLGHQKSSFPEPNYRFVCLNLHNFTRLILREVVI